MRNQKEARKSNFELHAITNFLRAAVVFRLIHSVAMTTTLEKASFGAGWCGRKSKRKQPFCLTVSFLRFSFWGVEKWYKKEFPKLKSTSVGYQGGSKSEPTYKEVCTGTTGHAEVLEVEYDPKEVNYEDLVRYFYRVHDPTTVDSQGPDIGSQYRSAIFYYNEEQKKIAEKVTADIAQNSAFKAAFGGRNIVTQIQPATTFYIAEDYHQDYLDHNPTGYCTHKVRW